MHQVVCVSDAIQLWRRPLQEAVQVPGLARGRRTDAALRRVLGDVHDESSAPSCWAQEAASSSAAMLDSVKSTGHIIRWTRIAPLLIAEPPLHIGAGGPPSTIDC